MKIAVITLWSSSQSDLENDFLAHDKLASRITVSGYDNVLITNPMQRSTPPTPDVVRDLVKPALLSPILLALTMLAFKEKPLYDSFREPAYFDQDDRVFALLVLPAAVVSGQATRSIKGSFCGFSEGDGATCQFASVVPREPSLCMATSRR